MQNLYENNLKLQTINVLIYQFIKNKQYHSSIPMIRANRQLIPDRRLFQNFHKHSATLQIDCEPHRQQHLNQETKNMVLSLQRTIMTKLQQINTKIQKLDHQLQRLIDIVRFDRKRSRKVFTFANSPNDKPYSISNTPQSAKKYLHQTSTEPNTFKKYDFQLTNQKNFVNQQIVYLHRQIQILRQQLHRTHNIANLNFSINENNFSSQRHKKNFASNIDIHNIPLFQQGGLMKSHTIKNLYRQLDYMDESPQKQEKIEQNQKIARLQVIIKQYQKQQEVLRLLAGKADKYRQCLKSVLIQLRNLRKQLPQHDPCQACQLKKIVNRFLNLGININLAQTQDKNSYSIKNQKKCESERQNQPSLSKDDYKFSQNSSLSNRKRARTYAYLNQGYYDQDQLLVQLQRNTNSQNSGII